jgi:hypothetical protein
MMDPAAYLSKRKMLRETLTGIHKNTPVIYNIYIKFPDRERTCNYAPTSSPRN